ncbi:MAG TPA: hypothetical protein VHU88_05780 [Sporichthyaceae bacterium]|nr:hypothetical protein [Sporichthyaceae bacterium]
MALAVLAAVGLFLVALRLLTNRAVSLREVLPGASANVVLKRHRYPRALSRRRPPRSTGMSTAMNAPPRPVRRGRQTILTDRQTWIGGAMSHLTWCQVNCVSCGFVPRCAGSRGSMRALTDRAAAGAG